MSAQRIYVTRAGDSVDGVLWSELGRTDDAVEREFWSLNTDAALKLDASGRFPKGVRLSLPEIPAEQVLEAVGPWD